MALWRRSSFQGQYLLDPIGPVRVANLLISETFKAFARRSTTQEIFG